MYGSWLFIYTTNIQIKMRNTNFKLEYIYTLSDPITNKVMYIGKTNNIDDRFKRHISDYYLNESNSNKNKWIKKLKSENKLPIMEILDQGESEIIYDLEIYWISQFKQWGFKLTNMTEGGDGFINCDNKPVLTEKSYIKRKLNSSNINPILQFDMDNKFIKYYDSCHDVNKITGYHRSHISGICKGKKGFYSCKGYYFRYLDNYFPCIKAINPNIDDINKIINSIKSEIELRRITVNKREKKVRKTLPVVEYDKNGNILGEYKSTESLANILKLNVSTIRSCCRNKKHFTAYGRIFRYKKDKFEYTEFDKSFANIPICKYNKDGKFLGKFDSIKLASESVKSSGGCISRCCKRKLKKNGKYVIVKGYTWRYYSETKCEDLIPYKA